MKYILVFLLFAFQESHSQTNQSVKLLDSISLKKNEKYLVLKETDTFKIVTAERTLFKNCEKFIKAHNIDFDKQLLNVLKANNEIHLDSLEMTPKLKSRLMFRIASLIEEGNCLVLNKQNRKLERSMIIENYLIENIKGRKFKTEHKTLVLKTVDGIF